MNKTFDRSLSLVLVAVCAVFIFESTKMLKGSFGSTIGPGLLPMIMAIVLAILSLINFYQTFRVKNSIEKGEKLQYKRFLILLGTAILYCLLLEPLGYVISTFLFLTLAFQVMEKGKMIYSCIFSAIISFGVYFLYVDVMKGTLPGLPVWLGF
ncbi:tripartite tricarboxylate transporter TctB family protein [Neobacillus sp. 3P2-tot-E-2]|uniref:tripartite tricarboxylate transporter TctB family protein n=1 Tax=Neobacillus sp. 3P2-tot-E-2 TaxID=3132212 RepID=UPI0039A13D35